MRVFVGAICSLSLIVGHSVPGVAVRNSPVSRGDAIAFPTALRLRAQQGQKPAR
jgi:hypothetical protein